MGLQVYQSACEKGLVSREVLTIIDYSKPSYERRMWVIDVKHKKLLFNTLVAHGKGSGNIKATRFSNNGKTHASSLGVFLTGKTYKGKHGLSLALHGLEPHFNGHVFSRRIVIHGASYVNDHFAQQYGRIGRSWGCLALDEAIAPQVIETIKGGSIILAYYPDQKWLKTSQFLHPVVQKKWT